MRLGQARIERLLAAADCGEVNMEGLYHARRGGMLVGAAWGQITPGHAAFCWPACLVAGEPEATAQHLMQAVNEHLDAAGVEVTQAILPPRDVVSALRLNAAGYQHLAELDYLVSEAAQFPRAEPRGELSFTSVERGKTARLSELIERTYSGTLDCSRLEDVRSVDQVLRGYRRTGVYRPEWWVTARHEGHDVGCVLLADHPEHDQVELMYVGIVSEWRGRGWGRELARYAQWLAHRAARDRIVLAVDDANWPARSIYDCLGFQLWDRRSVYVRTARSDGPPAPSSDT